MYGLDGASDHSTSYSAQIPTVDTNPWGFLNASASQLRSAFYTDTASWPQLPTGNDLGFNGFSTGFRDQQDGGSEPQLFMSEDCSGTIDYSAQSWNTSWNA
jgi:hypothetical protein